MKIFIVEDSLAVRENLHSMLSDIPGATMVGYAADELNAVKCIDALLPDVVILDLKLESGNGISVLKNIKKHHAAIKVVVLTNHANEFYADRCKQAGTDYFFDKSFHLPQVHSALWVMSSLYDRQNSPLQVPGNSSRG